MSFVATRPPNSLRSFDDLEQVVSHRRRVPVGERALVLHVVERRVVDALLHLDLVPPFGDQARSGRKSIISTMMTP